MDEYEAYFANRNDEKFLAVAKRISSTERIYLKRVEYEALGLKLHMYKDTVLNRLRSLDFNINEEKHPVSDTTHLIIITG